MTLENFKTKRFDKEHRHYGGLIHPSDFNTNYRNIDNKYLIVSRIISDMKWEQELYLKSQNRREGELQT